MGLLEGHGEGPGRVHPGLIHLPPGTERHHVPGGGSRAVQISAGDILTVLDREGGQGGELVAFGRDGRADAGLIGARASGLATGLQDALMASPTGVAVAGVLRRGGCDLDAAEAVYVHGRESRPGDRVEFTAQADALVVLAASLFALVVHRRELPVVGRLL